MEYAEAVVSSLEVLKGRHDLLIGNFGEQFTHCVQKKGEIRNMDVC